MGKRNIFLMTKTTTKEKHTHSVSIKRTNKLPAKTCHNICAKDLQIHCILFLHSEEQNDNKTQSQLQNWFMCHNSNRKTAVWFS